MSWYIDFEYCESFIILSIEIYALLLWHSMISYIWYMGISSYCYFIMTFRAIVDSYRKGVGTSCKYIMLDSDILLLFSESYECFTMIDSCRMLFPFYKFFTILWFEFSGVNKSCLLLGVYHLQCALYIVC